MIKKRLIPTAICFTFFFISCSTISEMTGNSVAFQKNLTIKSKTYEFIEGVTTVNRLKVRYIGFWRTYSLSFLEYIMPGELPFYAVEILVDGQGWTFYEDLDAKIDTQIYRFTDENPSRNVISGGRTQEVISAILTMDLIKEIHNASSLSIGLGTNIFQITEEELAAIKDFLPKS